MPRLFTALELPHDVADELELLRGGVDGARWIDRDSYHLTLRFFGDVDGPVAAELQAELGSIDGFPFELALKGIDAFGGQKPRSIWAGVRSSDALTNFAARPAERLIRYITESIRGEIERAIHSVEWCMPVLRSSGYGNADRVRPRVLR